MVNSEERYFQEPFIRPFPRDFASTTSTYTDVASGYAVGSLLE